MFLRKGVLKRCSKFTIEHSCQSVIEIALQHGCSPGNLLHIFRARFPKNSSRQLLLNLKTRIVRKKAHEISETSFLFWCNVCPSAHLRNYLFPGTSFIYSRFSDFTEVLMKDLARMLIYVRKTKNCRVSFKMLLSMCLVFAEKGL